MGARTGVVVALGAVAAVVTGAPAPTTAQPEPSFKTTCGGLRQALAALPPVADAEAVVTIQVAGAVTAARKGEDVAYVVICSPPDPLVACITYEIEGRVVGEPAIVTGAFSPGGRPDRIVLDPCLHFTAEKAP